jgi:proteic killer suppression protein
MGIRSFKDEDAFLFFNKGLLPRKKGWASVGKLVRRKLDMLHYAKNLNDLLSPPGNRLERLSGNLAGYYSVRVNDQWRIVFKWDVQPFDVSVRDYH